MFFYIIYEFSFVFGLISGKREEISKNLGNVGGPSPCQGVACHAAAWSRRGFFHPRVRRDEAVHNMKNVMFYFSFVSVAPRTRLLDK